MGGEEGGERGRWWEVVEDGGRMWEKVGEGRRSTHWRCVIKDLNRLALRGVAAPSKVRGDIIIVLLLPNLVRGVVIVVGHALAIESELDWDCLRFW